jgi:hypothetical protein
VTDELDAAYAAAAAAVSDAAALLVTTPREPGRDAIGSLLARSSRWPARGTT